MARCWTRRSLSDDRAHQHINRVGGASIQRARLRHTMSAHPASRLPDQRIPAAQVGILSPRHVSCKILRYNGLRIMERARAVQDGSPTFRIELRESRYPRLPRDLCHVCKGVTCPVVPMRYANPGMADGRPWRGVRWV